MWWLLAVLLILSLIYLYRTNPYTYWQREKVPHEKVKFPLGCLSVLRNTKERSLGTIISDIYQQSDAKLYGINFMFRPVLMVRDINIAHHMLTSDFGSFHDRGVDVDDGQDLFSLQGKEWKLLRMKLTPSFSTGKLKGMFETIDAVGTRMVEHLNELLIAEKTGVRVEIKDIYTTYAIDIIGSVIFGLEIDSFSNPKNEFRSISSNLFQRDDLLSNLRVGASFVYPPFCRFMTKIGYKDPVITALKNIVKRTVAFRENHKVVRKDLLQLLIELRNTGKISEDNEESWNMKTPNAGAPQMSMDTLASQAFLFYLAGSETTAAAASFTLYELAMYPLHLKRAQLEVAKCLEKHGLKPEDNLTYEVLQDMPFLDLCLMETLRKYPGLPFLSRECTKDYPVPRTDYTIKKGTPILIPIQGIQRDPKFFSDPDCYDPERFLTKTNKPNAASYMPFGEGPRHCIALRMGKLNAKIGLIKILANFDIETIPRQELQFVYDPTLASIPKGGVHLHLSRKVASHT